MEYSPQQEWLQAPQGLLAQAGLVFDEVTWRLDGVHPKRWVSPAAHAMDRQVGELRLKAHLIQDLHATATSESAAARLAPTPLSPLPGWDL